MENKINIPITEFQKGDRFLLIKPPKYLELGVYDSAEVAEMQIKEISETHIKLKDFKTNKTDWYPKDLFFTKGEYLDFKILNIEWEDLKKKTFKEVRESKVPNTEVMAELKRNDWKFSPSGLKLARLQKKWQIFEKLPKKEEMLEELSHRVVKFIKENNLI